MKTLDAAAAAAAMYALFEKRPELMAEALAFDAALEPDAVALVLAITREDFSAWATAPQPVRAVATALMTDLFKNPLTPHPHFAQARWQVRSLSKHRQALEVAAHEIARSHPAQARPN